jgi:hypothetical protein
MSVATSTALAIGGIAAAGVGATTSLVGAHEQASAAGQAADQSSQAAANSLAFNKQVYSDTRAAEQPYLAAGNTAANALGAGIADGSLTAGFAPKFSFTGVDLLNDPAYKFNLEQGTNAVQQSAAARGGLVSGGTLKDLSTFGQGYASNQFQQSYQNALQNYNTAFNVFNSNQGNQFARLASVAGLGQNAATGTATSGAAASGTGAQIALNGAANTGNFLTQGAVAGSAGLVGAGNAATSGINSVANSLALQSGSSYGNQFASPPMGYVSPDMWAQYNKGSF